MDFELPDDFPKVGPEDRSEYCMSDLVCHCDDTLRMLKHLLMLREAELEEIG